MASTLHQRKFRLDIRANIFIEGVLKDWNRLPIEAAESSPLEMFKSCSDVVLRDTV